MAVLDLHCRDTGSGPPLLLLHGFTAHGAAWDRLAADLAPRYRVLQVDLPGHGRSPAPLVGYNFDDCTSDIVAVLNRCGIEKCSVLGYSMGGRIALALATQHPHRVERLILESASPGIADAETRAERACTDRQLAAEIESQPFASFIDRWMAQPLFHSQRTLPAEERRRARAIRLDNQASSIAAALRALGSGSQPSYWEDLPALNAPTLLINGDSDDKFDRIARAMHERLLASRRQVIRGAGHATHLENPSAFAESIDAFLGGL